MEATKPQESKRTILRRVAVIVKAARYPGFVFTAGINPTLIEILLLYLWQGHFSLVTYSSRMMTPP